METITYTEKDKLAFKRLQSQGPLGKRALYTLQYLFLRNDFHRLIKEVREQCNIPPDGYEVDRTSKEKTTYPGLTDDEFRKLEKYVTSCGILSYAPNMFLAESFHKYVIMEYALFNDFFGLYKKRFALISFETYDDDMNGTMDQQEQIELRIEFPVSAKKDEIIDFIKTNWDRVEEMKQGSLKEKDQVRFRPRNNFFRDLTIFNKYLEIENLTRTERKNKQIDYIEIGVQRELKEMGIKDVPDTGTIRSIYSRLKNDIKDKNHFWMDIEDDPEPDPNYKPTDDDF